MEFIVASATPSTPRPPSNSPAYLPRSSARSQPVRVGFCVLTLFILALIKMWWGGFLSPGLGGYCGGEIGDCGGPPWAAHKKPPHPLPVACHSPHLGPAVTPCGRAAVNCGCWLVKRHSEGSGMQSRGGGSAILRHHH